MIRASELISQLKKPLPYSYYRTVDFLVEKSYLIKTRLYIKYDTFVQIYRNDGYNTTSFTLIVANKRVFARDQIRGEWHRHPFNKPEKHNFSPNGVKPCTLSEFLNEADKILRQLEIV